MPGTTITSETPGSGFHTAEPGPGAEPSPVPSTFVRELQEQGIAMILGNSTPALERLASDFVGSERVRAESEKFQAGDKRRTVKQFLVKYQEQQQFTREHPLYRAGIELLPMVEAAIGPCRFISADMWLNLPGAEQRGRQWSQNWHRDPEGETVVKVMLFLEEVDEESGPFEYVVGSHNKYFDACKPKSYLQPSGAKCLDGVDVLRCCVPKNTLVFANTAGLHRGGCTRSKSRLSCVWTYVPAGNPLPVSFSLN